MRLDIASPSGSRTIGQPTTSTGRLRSSTRRVITASCWASLRPKNAEHGPTTAKSFVTTVATPSKWVGRAAPHRSAVRPATCTVVSGGRGVHLGDARREHAVDALGLARLEITGEIARVPVEILAGAELQRVHEDRHDDEVGRGHRRAHQRAVTGVQESHRRHDADPLPRRARRSSQAARRSAIRST